MSKFYIASRDGTKNGRIYEVAGDEVSLISNRKIRFKIPTGETLKKTLEYYENQTWPNPKGDLDISELEIDVGQYFPSIARPIYSSGPSIQNPIWFTDMKLSKAIWRELDIATRDLESCFDVTSPAQENFAAFGIAFEKIIYSCCIGVEGLFRKILKDNLIHRKEVNMKLFAKLNKFLKLDEYQVSFIRYPWLDDVRPYVAWSLGKQDKLEWFEAYNALKHDKRNKENLASLQNAIYATSAYYILSYAVFGKDLFPGFFSDSFYFRISAYAEWDISEFYFKADDDAWLAKHIPF